MEGDVFVQILKMNVEILLKGGDERIQIRPETGRNKYHLNPLEFAGLLSRGINRAACGIYTKYSVTPQTINGRFVGKGCPAIGWDAHATIIGGINRAANDIYAKYKVIPQTISGRFVGKRCPAIGWDAQATSSGGINRTANDIYA